MLHSLASAPQLQGVWRFDPISFIIGVIFSAVIFGVLFLFRFQLRDGSGVLRQSLHNLRERISASTETRYNEALRDLLPQRHLVEHIAPLTDLYLPPRFEPPAPRPSLARYTMPPESLSLHQVLAASTRLAVLGPSGSGRSTLLLHLARIFLDGQPAKDLLLDEKRLPALLNLVDIDWRAQYPDPLTPLIAGAIARMPRLLAANLTSMLKRRLANEPMLILIDGWDELSADERANAGAWLAALIKAHPTHRYVISGSTHNCAELYRAGFACLAIALLSARDAQTLTRRWIALAHASPSDATLLFEALQQPPGLALRPLDFTLAASVWHKRGLMPLNLLTVYDHWLDDTLEDAGIVDNTIARAFLQHIAWTMFTQNRTSLTRVEIDAAAAQLFPETEQGAKAKDIAAAIIGNRVLFTPQANELAFVHARIAAYLVAQHAAQNRAALDIAAHVDHPLYEDAAFFFAGLGDAAPLVDAALAGPDDVFHTALTRVGMWASLAPDQAAWRKRILSELSRVLTAPETPGHLRERVMRTVLATRDRGVNYLFKQMTGHKESYLRRPGLQAYGWMRREADVALVAPLVQDPDPDVRHEALRVLGQIGGANAVDTLAQTLLEGEDESRRVAAEALSECGQPGWDLLSEGAQLKDDQGADLYRVRRAACYGLARVDQPWAIELLTKLMREDKQWIVRSGAEDALATARGDEAKQDENAFKLDLTPIDPDNIGWLIEWGVARGESIGPGAPSRRALQRALEDDAVKVRLAAANTYAYVGDSAAVNALRQRLHDPEPEIRDAAYRALIHIAQRTNQRIPV